MLIMGFGCLQPGGGCCGGTDVLIWNKDASASLHTSLRSHYTARGLVAHLFNEFSGTLSDYSLIIWPVAASDPSWLSDLASWSGRLHVSGESSPSPPLATNVYINDLLSDFAVSISLDDTAGTFSGQYMPGTETDLAVANIFGGSHSPVTGGAVVYKIHPTGTSIMMTRERVGDIDWVVGGDSSHTENSSISSNSAFFNALYDAA